MLVMQAHNQPGHAGLIPVTAGCSLFKSVYDLNKPAQTIYIFVCTFIQYIYYNPTLSSAAMLLTVEPELSISILPHSEQYLAL